MWYSYACNQPCYVHDDEGVMKATQLFTYRNCLHIDHFQLNTIEHMNDTKFPFEVHWSPQIKRCRLFVIIKPMSLLTTQMCMPQMEHNSSMQCGLFKRYGISLNRHRPRIVAASNTRCPRIVAAQSEALERNKRRPRIVAAASKRGTCPRLRISQAFQRNKRRPRIVAALE